VVAQERVLADEEWRGLPHSAADLLIRCQHKLREAAGALVEMGNATYAREFSELSAQIHEYRFGERGRS
jgi:hypothetical protein